MTIRERYIAVRDTRGADADDQYTAPPGRELNHRMWEGDVGALHEVAKSIRTRDEPAAPSASEESVDVDRVAPRGRGRTAQPRAGRGGYV